MPTSVPPATRSHSVTLSQPAMVGGVTLFTAAATSLIIRPAPAGHGIVFRRTDLPDQPRIPALVRHVVPESRHTVLSPDPADRAAPVIHTVEHILSALAGLGITDALLDLQGQEVPIGDGSAAPFVQALRDAGVCRVASDAPEPEPIIIREPITVTDDRGEGRIEALPPLPGEHALDLSYDLDYGPTSPLPAQRATLRLDAAGGADTYAAQIAPARTFCLAEEAQAMRKMGFFKHLEPRDMLVIGEDGQPIDNALHFPDEPARHKLLDLLGDLALTGRPIVGRIAASRSGHALNHEMARKLLAHAGVCG